MSEYISETLKSRIREQSSDRCGYCQSLQKYVWGTLEIEHTLPKSKGGQTIESNLWLACRPCNGYKADQIDGIDPITQNQVPLFNPRTQKWHEHFTWSDDSISILGITEIGRVTVQALQMNNTYAMTVRSAWVSVGWHPPRD